MIFFNYLIHELPRVDYTTHDDFLLPYAKCLSEINIYSYDSNRDVN